MRLLDHPGPVAAPRHLIAWGEAGPSYRLRVAEGDDLIGALIRELTRLDVRSAGAVLLGGSVARLSFMTGRPIEAGETERRVATHNGPHEIACPARVIGGNAILGADAEGRPLVHCHALFADRDGRVCGGHLLPDGCLAGPEGIALHVAALEGTGFQVAHDAETNFDIFHPGGSETPS